MPFILFSRSPSLNLPPASLVESDPPTAPTTDAAAVIALAPQDEAYGGDMLFMSLVEDWISAAITDPVRGAGMSVERTDLYHTAVAPIDAPLKALQDARVLTAETYETLVLIVWLSGDAALVANRDFCGFAASDLQARALDYGYHSFTQDGRLMTWAEMSAAGVRLARGERARLLSSSFRLVGEMLSTSLPGGVS